MRILMITPLYPPAVGGAATYFGEVAPELSQREEVSGVTILTERVPGRSQQAQDAGVRVLRCLPARIAGVQRQWPVHAASYLLTQLWFALRLPCVARRCKADLVHFHTRYRGPLFRDALRRCRLPVIADLHDKMSHPEALAHVADRLLCCGQGVQEFAVAGGFPRARTELVPLPFTPPVAASPQAVLEVRERHGLGNARYLLFVGDITRNKGVYELLEAHRQWRMRQLEVALVLAGPNREGSRFLERLRRAEGAVYLGPVPHHDVLALMQGAEVVLLPSRSEGLPRVILEAVALGRRVVCPPGVPEFEHHLPEYALPDVSTEAILHVLENIWGRGDTPQYPFATHQVDHAVDKMVSVYADVTSRGG